MAKKLIDVDIETLEEAMRILGSTTYREAVNAGLREIIAAAARRREIERFTAPVPDEIQDAAVVASAWR